jgi:hypothetical protein
MLVFNTEKTEGLMYMMLTWSGRPVVPEHMLVMFRIAQQMMTGIIEATTVDFTHEHCEGRLLKGKAGILGNCGGTAFHGDFGEYEGVPHTVDFFVPRYAAHTRLNDGIVTMSRYDRQTGMSNYPYDVDTTGLGGIRIKTVKT